LIASLYLAIATHHFAIPPAAYELLVIFSTLNSFLSAIIAFALLMIGAGMFSLSKERSLFKKLMSAIAF